jgi:hypothetical protein
MTSQIDPTVPVFGTPTTASIRNNFLIARDEISAIQIQLGQVAPITGVLSAVTDANAKAVLTSIISALVGLGLVTDRTI